MTLSPLRAYYIELSSNDEWKVQVCRSLSEALSAWSSRDDQLSSTGILHIGFDRPTSQTFYEVAKAFPGRMLLTDAAKYALPSTYVSSRSPVGIAESHDVFLALQGWGYSDEDPSKDENGNDLNDAAPTEYVAREWIALFLREHPVYKDRLQNANIYDDATYLESEKLLNRDSRHKIGMFRCHYFIGAKFDDPCEFARCAPPWLADRAIANLELSVRSRNALHRLDARTVQDLSRLSSNELLQQKNVGQKSIRDILTGLRTALDEGPAPDVVHQMDTGPGQLLQDTESLLSRIRSSLMQFKERDRDILVCRLGFGTRRRTLEELAKSYDVTRERIRQIEKRAIEKWMRVSLWDDILQHKVGYMLAGRSFPLPVAGIEALDPWFEGLSAHVEFFARAVEIICKGRIHVIEVEGIHYISTIDQETWNSTVKEGSRLLALGAERHWEEEYARSLVQGLLPDKSKEFREMLWDICSVNCYFTVSPDGVRELSGFGNKTKDLVSTVLESSETPLHFKEIAQRVGSLKREDLDVRTIHKLAADLGHLFGPGTYGLDKHLPVTQEQMQRILTEAEEIIAVQAPGKQWHSSELLGEISERLDDEAKNLDKYVLGVILKKSQIVIPLGKMTWALAQPSATQPRVDIYQAILSILKGAGRPLSTAEIKERLTAVRGINEVFQIQPTEDLVRIESGKWGLADRDLPLSRSEMQGRLNELAQLLEERNTGLHTSEVPDLIDLQECPAEALFSMAAQDPRLRISQGRYVYLEEWGTPRRKSVAEAVADVIAYEVQPLTIEQIRSEVEAQLQRHCKPLAVSTALRNQGAVYDPSSRKWNLSPGSPESLLEDEN